MISGLDTPEIALYKLREIRAELSNGIFDEMHGISAGNAFELLLVILNRNPKKRITKTALYSSMGVSRSIISNVVNQRHGPKMENVFPIIDNLIREYENVLGLSSISVDALQGVPAVFIFPNQKISAKISVLNDLLVELVGSINGSNSISETLLRDVSKQQLIVVLEFALAQLKAPVVEISSLKKLESWLAMLAKRSADKGVEAAVGKLAAAAAASLLQILKALLS
jgi:hypothetical protein